MFLWHLIFVIFFFAYKIESGKIRPNFEEIFGKRWDKNESEEETIKIKQKEENENSEFNNFINQNIGENENIEPNDQQKRETIHKFDAIKEKLKEKGKYQWQNRVKIETKIAKFLGITREKIYKWKKELNLNKKKMMKRSFYEGKKSEFIERFDEFKSLYGHGKKKEFVKELGISEETFRKWKKELVLNYLKKHDSNEIKLQKMKQYFKIKKTNPKISDKTIAKKLGIGRVTLIRWKKKFTSFIL